MFWWNLSVIENKKTHTDTHLQIDPIFLPLYTHGQIDLVVVGGYPQRTGLLEGV